MQAEIVNLHLSNPLNLLELIPNCENWTAKLGMGTGNGEWGMGMRNGNGIMAYSSLKIAF